MSAIDKVIEECKKWVGYLEKASNSQLDDFKANAGSKNFTCFARDYCNDFGEDIKVYQGQPWCAMFVSEMFAKTFGAKMADKMIYGHYAYCPYGVKAFQKAGKWYVSNPQPGDIIFFKDSSGVASHTGIVISVASGNITTIEGNTSGVSTVIANGGGVFKKTYSTRYSRIMGFGRPNYDLVKEEVIEEYTTNSAIVWDLYLRQIITDTNLWISKCMSNEDVYWLCRKLCHYIRTKTKGETADEAYTDLDAIVWDLHHRGIISDKDLWMKYGKEDEDIYWLMMKGLHYCRTY